MKGAALNGAVRMGHLSMVEWLLAHNAPVNARDFAGKTPLAVALSTCQNAIVDVLQRHGGLDAHDPVA